MSSYESLALRYDALTADVDHEAWADYLEKHFSRCPIPIRTPPRSSSTGRGTARSSASAGSPSQFRVSFQHMSLHTGHHLFFSICAPKKVVTDTFSPLLSYFSVVKL